MVRMMSSLLEVVRGVAVSILAPRPLATTSRCERAHTRSARDSSNPSYPSSGTFPRESREWASEPEAGGQDFIPFLDTRCFLV